MIKCDNVGKAIINRPPNHYFDRWYGYHSQSWVVYGIVLPTWHQDFPWNKPSIFHIFTGFSIRSSTFMGFSISHHIFLGYSIYIYIYPIILYISYGIFIIYIYIYTNIPWYPHFCRHLSSKSSSSPNRWWPNRWRSLASLEAQLQSRGHDFVASEAHFWVCQKWVYVWYNIT